MQITRVTLKNVKSYGNEEAVVRFDTGVNLIKGENGAGKSTILEAIGFALFDTLPYGIKEFVRQGTKRGEITVSLISAVDDREYEVIREVSGSSIYVYDPETDAKLAVGKEDTTAWIRDHLINDLETDRDALFNDIVGVPQGTMTAIFMETPRLREEKFNRLLRVESYREAYKNLGATVNYLDDLVQQNREDQIRLQTRLKELPEKQADYARLKQALEADEARSTQNQSRLQFVESEIARLDDLKKAIDNLLRSIEKCDQTLLQLRARLQAADADSRQSQNAQQILADTRDAYEAYQSADLRLNQLEIKRKERDELVLTQGDFEAKLRECKLRLAQVVTELEKVQQAETRMLELLPLVKEQARLEAELARVRAAEYEQQALERQLGESRERVKQLASVVEKLQGFLLERQKLDAQITERKHQRDTLVIQREALYQNRQPLVQQLAELTPQLNHQLERVKQYELERANVERCEREITIEKANIERLRPILQRRTESLGERDSLQAQLEAAQRWENEASASLKNYTEQLNTLAERQRLLGTEKAICPVCQRPMDEHARTDVEAHYQSETLRLQREIADTDVGRQEALRQIKGVSQHIKRLNTELERLETDVSLLASERRLADLEDKHTSFAAAIMLVVDAPNKASQLEQQKQESQGQLETLDAEIRQLDAESQEISREIERAQDALKEFPQEKELIDRQQEQANLIGEIELAQAQLNAMGDVARVIQTLAAALQALGDPRLQYQIAEAVVQQRETLKTELTRYEAQVRELEVGLLQKTQLLEPFAQLESEIAEVKLLREHSHAGYRLHLANEQIAALFQVRQTAYDNLCAEQELAETRRSNHVDQREELETRYDGLQHNTLINEQNELRQDQAAIKARVELHTQELQRVETRLGEFVSAQAELETLTGAVNQLNEEKEACKFVRNSIRDAGEKVRTRLVQSIGQQADLIFKQIMDDATHTLSWSSDYGLSLTHKGETRAFRLLSGGEQMTAALSVRLALLTHMTRVRFVFLDEPTMNLDEKRRVNLAEKLANIHNLQQIFVISHDDTFEQDSNHIIEVTKVNGVSRVSY